MILDIPQEKDFNKIAVSLLNLAWETALNLALSLDDAQKQDVDVEEDLYWQTSQTQLATSISLVQQAFEFFLKSRIVGVSPFFLIVGTAKTWPRGCDEADTPFADFYTIDAQELIRTHDTVAPVRLPDIIKQAFEGLRRKRNTIIHTVDKRLQIEAKEIIVAILDITNHFIGEFKWTETRKQHLQESADPIGYPDSDGVTYGLVRELTWVVNALEPAQVKNFFGIDKKQRAYACPICLGECQDAGIEPKLAFLVPNEPASTNLHCYICTNDQEVIRRDCEKSGCKGNVLDADDEMCLTCQDQGL